MKKSEKILFVQNLTEELKSSTGVILVNYSGLTVKAQQELKKRLKAVDARMLVVKNTLLRLSGKGAHVSEDVLSDGVLSGPTALVITEADPIAPLSLLHKFSQEFETPQFKVGLIDGKFQDFDTLIKLAQLPGKEVLSAQLVGTIAGPMYGLAATLQANLEKLVYILKTRGEQS